MKAGVTRTALCTGQVIKEKVHRVSAQMYLQATVQDGLLKDTPSAATFSPFMHNMAALSFFQDGVSGVHKITRYNDEGLKRRENSLIFFPLEIKYM